MYHDFLLEILEKNNDECILILVIYWKKTGLLHTKFFFLLALQPPLGVVFYSPLVGFSLLAYEVFWSHTTTRHSR